MEGIKTIVRSKRDIINAIYDIIELQNGELILSDSKRGKVHFQLTMYGYVWELLYSISDMGIGKCDVSLRVVGERQDKAREIRREFALLETMLGGGADVRIVGS
jgi:hypothetical protein